MLGNFRANRIMDHFDKVQDPSLGRLVWKYYRRFNSCIQTRLEKRNAERKNIFKLGYQFFEPKWLPNSVHI